MLHARMLAVRLLVVEDDERLAATLKRGLEAQSFAVDVAHTGPDGLWMASNFSYDLIVLDLMLPGMNGQRICALLREQGQSVPILMLTAKDGEYDEADSLDLGADDFLSKPFSYTVLLARVRALLRRGTTLARAPLVQLGPVEFDPAAHVCRRDGIEIRLTLKESSILEYLARRRDAIVSKDELIEHAWDTGFEGAHNVVEVHVSALRRKLGAGVIDTVRGAGYRISSRAR